jgi:PIN domain nuclease of toxin-antitoxin system
MNLLLDTHILLWLLAAPERLSTQANNVILQARKVYFSPVNLWEIGIKTSIWPDYGIARIEDIHAAALQSNLQELTVASIDTMLATQLPAIHRDPFDRLLIAQSHNHQCHLMTVDNKIAEYQMPYIMTF